MNLFPLLPSIQSVSFRSYKNVICFNCNTFKCNGRAIKESKSCYNCSCDNCTSDEDEICIKPNRTTQAIVREEAEVCLLATWEMDYAQKTIFRGIGTDLTQCLAKKNKQATAHKFNDIVCKLCNEDRCNGEVATVTKKPVCYTCECKNCTFQTARTCIRPARATWTSWPMKENDFCVLFVVRAPDGGVHIERSKQCEADYCERKFVAFTDHDRMFCVMCNDDRCNGFDRSDVIMQMMRTKQKRNETNRKAS